MFDRFKLRAAAEVGHLEGEIAPMLNALAEIAADEHGLQLSAETGNLADDWTAANAGVLRVLDELERLRDGLLAARAEALALAQRVEDVLEGRVARVEVEVTDANPQQEVLDLIRLAANVVTLDACAKGFPLPRVIRHLERALAGLGCADIAIKTVEDPDRPGWARVSAHVDHPRLTHGDLEVFVEIDGVGHAG